MGNFAPGDVKRKLQLLPLHFASSSRQEVKAGAFAYVAGEFCLLSLSQSQSPAARSRSCSNFRKKSNSLCRCSATIDAGARATKLSLESFLRTVSSSVSNFPISLASLSFSARSEEHTS